MATHYANELLLRLMIPRGLLATGSEEEMKKAASEKPITQSKMTALLEKVVKSYGCNLVESTTCWLFERNEIEGKKKIVLAPSEGTKGEGVPEVGEVWGVEMGVSMGTGKVKALGNRPTLHRRTTITYGLKRPSSRQILSEIVKKFGTFPFSLRQLDDERAAKVGVVECVRSNVLRQYEVVGDKDSEPVARLLSTVGTRPRHEKTSYTVKSWLMTLQRSQRTAWYASAHLPRPICQSTRPRRRLQMRRFSRSSSNRSHDRRVPRAKTERRRRSRRGRPQRRRKEIQVRRNRST